MRQVLLALFGGAGCIALGLAYVLHVFGPTEAEVACWGRVSIGLGFALAPLTAIIRRSSPRLARGMAGLGWGAGALLQAPPILLWFAFHGSGISDGTPPSAFVAHWAYALPHLAVLLLCGANVHGLGMLPRAGPRIRS